MLAAIDAQVDITLVELAELLCRDHRVSFAPSTIWCHLHLRGTGGRRGALALPAAQLA